MQHILCWGYCDIGSLYTCTFNFLSINLSSSNFLLSKWYGHCVQPTSSTSLKLTVFHMQLLQNLQLSLSYYIFKSPLPHHHFTYNSHALALNSRVLLTKLKWEINQAYVSSEVQKSRLCTIKTNTLINTLCVHTCIWQYAKEIKKPDEPMYMPYFFFPKSRRYSISIIHLMYIWKNIKFYIYEAHGLHHSYEKQQPWKSQLYEVIFKISEQCSK